MAREAALSVENNFSKGLITEATGLNYPENSITEGYNVLIDEKGTVVRRLGIDYETGYSLVQTLASIDNRVINEFVWDNVSSKGDLTFVVVQLGSTLYFFETSATTGLSNNKKSFTVNLNTYYVAGTEPTKEVECQFAAGNGDLFITSSSIEPIYVTYSVEADTITVTRIELKIRDFKGISSDGTTSLEERPTTLTATHKYNLYNQGWYYKAKVSGYNPDLADTTENTTAKPKYQNVLEYWDSRRSDYPSNTDVWWILKDSDENVNFKFLDTVFRGNTRAPNGHYLLNPFYEDRSAASGIPGLATYSSRYRPSSVAFFASRVFYSGIPFKEFGTNIYFSQIIESKEQYGKCHQAQDPTSEELSDLLPNDGGVIVIPDMGTVITMFSLQQGLLVFASNGVWLISGSQGLGFTATDYSVLKVSSIGALNHKSFVDIGGVPVWWTKDGIYTIVADPQTNGLNVASLSDGTIKTYLNDLPDSEFPHVKGAFNQRTKQIEWVYRSTASSSMKQRYQYDRILVFNTITNAFYPHSVATIDSNGPFINGIIATGGQGVVREDDPVLDANGDPVYDSLVEAVSVPIVSNSSLSGSFRYLTSMYNATTTFKWHITFSNQKNAGYLDWYTYDTAGVSFDSYFFTGYRVRGQAIRKFQTNYAVVFMEDEDDASLYLTGYWDYTNNANSGRVSISQQCYRNRNYFGMSHRRLKIRGSGLSLQMKFESEEGKPFTLIGWSAFETAGTLP